MDANKLTTKELREEFIKWARMHNYNTHQTSDGEFSDDGTHHAWQGFKACQDWFRD